MIELLIALFTKHFIVDFPLQNKFQYANKGTYGHPGGILHAFLHGISTWMIFAFMTPYAILYGLIDMIVHYHIDWIKMNLNAKLGYGPTTHERFWWLLGLDQYIHSLTYIFLVYVYSLKF